MLRILYIPTLLAALMHATPMSASVYTKTPVLAGRAAGSELASGSLFPGIVFGKALDMPDDSTSLSRLIAATNEFFRTTHQDERPQTVASLYGEVTEQKDTAPQADTATTVPVVIRGGPRDPIQIFTGADTSRILNQLFSGILNVHDDTFSHRRVGNRQRHPLFTTGGGSSLGSGSSLGGGGFLVTPGIASGQGTLNGPWISHSRIGQEFPAFKETRNTGNANDMMALLLKLLNPYFYGGLVLLLLFSVAWSLRFRMSSGNDAEPSDALPSEPPPTLRTHPRG